MSSFPRPFTAPNRPTVSSIAASSYSPTYSSPESAPPPSNRSRAAAEHAARRLHMPPDLPAPPHAPLPRALGPPGLSGACAAPPRGRRKPPPPERRKRRRSRRTPPRAALRAARPPRGRPARDSAPPHRAPRAACWSWAWAGEGAAAPCPGRRACHGRGARARTKQGKGATGAGPGLPYKWGPAVSLPPPFFMVSKFYLFSG